MGRMDSRYVRYTSLYFRWDGSVESFGGFGSIVVLEGGRRGQPGPLHRDSYTSLCSRNVEHARVSLSIYIVHAEIPKLRPGTNNIVPTGLEDILHKLRRRGGGIPGCSICARMSQHTHVNGVQPLIFCDYSLNNSASVCT